MATLHTPVFALPYPDGAERVMDGDNAIGALAQAAEAAMLGLRIPSPQQANASGALGPPLTTTPTVVPGTTVSYTSLTNEVAWALGIFDVSVTTYASTIRCGIYRDGILTVVGSLGIPAAANTIRLPVAVQFAAALTPGAHTWDLRGSQDVAGGSVTITGARLIVARFVISPTSFALLDAFGDALADTLEEPAPEPKKRARK